MNVWVRPRPHTHTECGTEASSSVPHFLQVGLLLNTIPYRCLLRLLCLVRRPVLTLDCILLKDSNQASVAGLRPEINFRACLWVGHTGKWRRWKEIAGSSLNCLGHVKGRYWNDCGAEGHDVIWVGTRAGWVESRVWEECHIIIPAAMDLLLFCTWNSFQYWCQVLVKVSIKCCDVLFFP
jgi:hypothetical protein